MVESGSEPDPGCLAVIVTATTEFEAIAMANRLQHDGIDAMVGINRSGAGFGVDPMIGLWPVMVREEDVSRAADSLGEDAALTVVPETSSNTANLARTGAWFLAVIMSIALHPLIGPTLVLVLFAVRVLRSRKHRSRQDVS